ncbi:hypothetical protein CC80DRAFT_492912 [Byssothecium circinans]|uniref:Uncharacterized protein n=1 Tax=Byssothecium circinans TaxID=147558 RepID=A0A6A5TST6_9PLEO|nr:hypothetical protein CC80DRAFT_492912 [Byssothecium circinans]
MGRAAYDMSTDSAGVVHEHNKQLQDTQFQHWEAMMWASIDDHRRKSQPLTPDQEAFAAKFGMAPGTGPQVEQPNNDRPVKSDHPPSDNSGLSKYSDQR